MIASEVFELRCFPAVFLLSFLVQSQNCGQKLLLNVFGALCWYVGSYLLLGDLDLGQSGRVGCGDEEEEGSGGGGGVDYGRGERAGQ